MYRLNPILLITNPTALCGTGSVYYKPPAWCSLILSPSVVACLCLLPVCLWGAFLSLWTSMSSLNSNCCECIFILFFCLLAFVMQRSFKAQCDSIYWSFLSSSIDFHVMLWNSLFSTQVIQPFSPCVVFLPLVTSCRAGKTPFKVNSKL